MLLQPDGSVTLGPIVDGDIFPPPGSTQQPSTQLVPQDIPNMAQIIGMIHNHAPGQHLPSPPSGIHGGDQAGMQTLVNVMNTPSYTQYNGGGGVNARFYIISQTTGPNPTYKLTVYGPETIKYDANGNPPSVGPEVNPNGQSCPI